MGHVVTWDGRNERGEIAPSGIYVVVFDRWRTKEKAKIAVEK
jgi:flagellar hook assembly protein FlgD